MRVIGIALVLVAGFLLSPTEGIFCYNCADCGETQGSLADCSRFSTSSSCYLALTISTGEISKACGSANLDRLDLPEGCTTEGDIKFCRCSQDRCNVNDLATSSAPNATMPPATTTSIMGDITTNAVATGNTTTVATSTPAEAFYCYVCLQCGSSLGTLVNCASFTTSRICYSQKDPSGDVVKMCGNDRLDGLDIPFGCTATPGYYTCKCSESECNDYRDTTTSPTTTTPTTTTPTTTTALSTTTTRSPQTSMTTPSSPGISCYVCRNCGSSVGVIFDCASAFQSTSCYLLKEPSGEITRFCGTPETDEIGAAYGCRSSRDGYIVCRCDTDNCNRYPNIVSGGSVETTPARPGPQTTTSSSSWMCYTCSDCDSSVGILTECSSFTDSRTCLLFQEPSGKVSRSCGLEAVDNFNLADGCGTNAGTTICKCSENACNEYPEYRTGSTSGVTTTPSSAAGTTSRATSDTGFYCHVCLDCGNSAGQLVSCPSSTSCVLVIENGKYSRLCGTAAVDIFIPEDDGCKLQGRSEICKCSRSECNTYYRKTKIMPNTQDTFLGQDPPNKKDGVTEQQTFTTFPSFTTSSATFNSCTWLVVAIAVGFALANC